MLTRHNPRAKIRGAKIMSAAPFGSGVKSGDSGQAVFQFWIHPLTARSRRRKADRLTVRTQQIPQGWEHVWQLGGPVGNEREVRTLEKRHAYLPRIVAGLIGDAIGRRSVGPKGIGPGAAGVVWAGRDRVIAAELLQTGAVQLDECEVPPAVERSQSSGRDIDVIYHFPRGIAEQRFDQGTGHAKPEVQYAECSGSTIEAKNWRVARAGSEKHRIVARTMDAIKCRAGWYRMNR